MNPSISDTGKLIDKVEHFGERFGFPAVISIIVVVGLMFSLYKVLNYEIFDSKEKLNAMGTDITEMMSQHQNLIDMSKSSLSIQCATCWNTADSQSEIKRCACTP